MAVGYGRSAASRGRGTTEQVLGNQSQRVSGEREPSVGPLDKSDYTRRLELVDEPD